MPSPKPKRLSRQASVVATAGGRRHRPPFLSGAGDGDQIVQETSRFAANGGLGVRGDDDTLPALACFEIDAACAWLDCLKSPPRALLPLRAFDPLLRISKKGLGLIAPSV
uniref:Uncharacterized protein n=1 Tax=Leersia perrieri TaxID=77586 RepID=A0A0D9WAW2_9ORYZ